MADDSVVVMKSRPVKAGNRLEDKTGTTCRKSRRGLVGAKSLIGVRRDEVHTKVSSNQLQDIRPDTKSLDEARYDERG